MKNAIRLSCFLLLLGALPGCTRENPPEYPPPQTTDQPAPAPSDTAPAEAVTRAPAPEPAPARPRVSRPSASDARPSEPAPAPARPVESVREREPVSPPPSTVSDARPDRAEPLDRTPREPAVRMQTVPAGTTLTVTTSDEISSSKSKEGDTFEAALTNPLIVDGHVVAERGDTVIGQVSDIVMPGKVKGRAQMTLVLTELLLNGRKYKIKTEPFVAIAVDNKERDAAIIAGGAGIGAAIGAITGGKKGAAIGAVIGGGGGTATVLATPGQSMKIEPETKVNFVLDDDFRLPVIRDRAD